MAAAEQRRETIPSGVMLGGGRHTPTNNTWHTSYTVKKNLKVQQFLPVEFHDPVSILEINKFLFFERFTIPTFVTSMCLTISLHFSLLPTIFKLICKICKFFKFEKIKKMDNGITRRIHTRNGWYLLCLKIELIIKRRSQKCQSEE